MPTSGHTISRAITALSSRRIWTLAEKRAILTEMAVPGAVVMEVARRHGIAQSLLYRWRSDAAAAAARTAPAFLPVTIKGPPAATTRKTVTRPRASSSSLASVIEIELVCGRTVRAMADIDTAALARIVAALETKA